jgi:hypothetical protein
MSPNPSPLEQQKPRARKFWIGLVSFILLFIALLIFSPWWHDKYFGMAQNESAAVGGLRMINALESQYAGAYPEEGFACELPQRPYDPIAALLAGEWSGYKFAIGGCTREANGVALRYHVTAVPSKPCSTGVRVFCTDQSGAMYYDLDGSPSRCITLRQVLPDLAKAGK